MTLNQVQKRIKAIVTAHNMVRSYNRQGVSVEFDTSTDKKYPSVDLLTLPGTLSLDGHYISYGFKLSAEDLVHVSQDTLGNEWEVISDCTQILMDVLAQMNSGEYYDWKVSSDNSLQFYFDDKADRVAGVWIDITIRVIYTQNICAVPSELTIINETDKSNYKVYDLKYIADGTEGTTLDSSVIASLADLTGKKVLHVIRENSPLHKVSNTPDPAEYTWNNTAFGFGAELSVGERLLILYRNY